jgi:hypothetical protein
MSLALLLALPIMARAQVTESIDITPNRPGYVFKNVPASTLTVKNQNSWTNMGNTISITEDKIYTASVVGKVSSSGHPNNLRAILRGSWTGSAVLDLDIQNHSGSASVRGLAKVGIGKLSSSPGVWVLSEALNKNDSITFATGNKTRPVRLIGKWKHGNDGFMRSSFTFQPGFAGVSGKAFKSGSTELGYSARVDRTVSWSFDAPNELQTGRPIAFVPTAPAGTTIPVPSVPVLVSVSTPGGGSSQGEYLSGVPDDGQFFVFNPWGWGQAGTYVIWLPGYLIQKIPIIEPIDETATTSTILPEVQVPIVPGDIDSDNEIGPGDFEWVTQFFGKSYEDPTWQIALTEAGPTPEFCDIDRDGEIGPSDLEVIVHNFGIEGEAWPTFTK